MPIQADAFGFAEAIQPLTGIGPGRTIYAQFLFDDAGDCGAGAPPSASSGLAIEVQPPFR